MPFLDEVHQRVVIYDGAVGTNLHLREPTIDDPRLSPHVYELFRGR